MSLSNVTVHWHIPVGCGFSGFFVEFLGVAAPLRKAWPELAVDTGACADHFYSEALFEEEGEALRQLHRPTLYEKYVHIDADVTATTGAVSPALPRLVQGDESWLIDMDLRGGDIPRSAAGLAAPSASACQAWCVARRACVGWTFRDERDEEDDEVESYDARRGDEVTGTCWLKGEHVAGEVVLGLTSGRVYDDLSTGGDEVAEAEEGRRDPVETGAPQARVEVELSMNDHLGVESASESRGGDIIDSEREQGSRHAKLRQPPFRVDVWHGRCDGMPGASSSRWKKCYAGHCIGWGTKDKGGGSSNGSPGSARRTNKVVVARLMTESDQIMNTQEVLECALKVDEVWVPTEFHRNVFIAAGVEPSRLQVIPEAVDGREFQRSRRPVGSAAGLSEGTGPFVFMSTFKWEHRKGWDVLLEAYWNAFPSPSDNVELRLRVWLPSWERGDRDLDAQITAYAKKKLGKARSELARVVWLGSVGGAPEALTRHQLRDTLAEANAFVLPTRGEGWGLPAAEAMTMGLPTIVTNWSGPTAFATPETAYLIPVSKTTDSRGYCQPSVPALANLMRDVVQSPASAAETGARARSHMTRMFSPDHVAGLISKRVAELAVGGVG